MINSRRIVEGTLLLALGAMLVAVPSLQAQGTLPTQKPANSNPPPIAHRTRHGKHPSCLQQAGVPQSVIEQRKTIEQEARAQVEAVCNDSSLSERQRRQKIHDIHQHSREQMERLLSPQQLEALKQCQRERGGGRKGGGHHGGAGGPCAARR